MSMRHLFTLALFAFLLVADAGAQSSPDTTIRLVGHRGHIYSAYFDASGTRIITASTDSTARIWDAASGLELLRLQSLRAPVRHALISPDGKRAITFAVDPGGKFTEGVLWDAVTGQALDSFTIDLYVVPNRPVLTPDSSGVVAISAHTRYLFGFNGYQQSETGYSWEGFSGLAFSPEGDIGVVSQSIYVDDPKTPVPDYPAVELCFFAPNLYPFDRRDTLMGRGGQDYAVAIAPKSQGGLIAVDGLIGAKSDVVALYNPKSKTVERYLDHQWVHTLLFARGYLYSVGGGTMKVWNLGGGLVDSVAGVLSVSYSRDEQSSCDEPSRQPVSRFRSVTTGAVTIAGTVAA
jgi:WD40 repeat protein